MEDAKQIKSKGNLDHARKPPHRWAKGESGNPKGRKPKADCLVSCIKDELAKKAEGSSYTNEQMIAFALVNKAKAGDPVAIRLTLEYVVGRPVQPVNLGNPDGSPLNVSFTIGQGYSK